MQKFLTDIHTHSLFSFDGIDELQDMLCSAQRKGVAFYGVSEHFDYDLLVRGNRVERRMIDEEEYFHRARHLQEDYQGVMNVLIGAEFSYIQDEKALAMYCDVVKKYKPDFIVNSVHSINGEDYYDRVPFYDSEGKMRTKDEVYKEYLGAIYESLFAPYPYQIVGHIGYAVRYAPYTDKALRYEDFAEEIDKILLEIIRQNKILEINSSMKDALCITPLDIFKRYFELGGRLVSIASDAHDTSRICDKREQLVCALKNIGFTHHCVPDRQEYILLEL